MEDKAIFKEVTPASYAEWLEQVTKDLKGADFNEKLVHTAGGISIQPLYTEGDIPAVVTEEEEDEDLDWMQDTADGKALSWSIAEHIALKEGDDMDHVVMDAMQRGVHYLRLSVEADEHWDAFCNALKRVQFPVQLSFIINSDLQEENVVSKWRNRMGMMGDRDRLVHALEFDPISFWNKNGKSAEPEKSFNALADLFFRLSGHLQDCKLVTVDITDRAAENPAEQLAAALQITTEYFHQLSKRNVPIEELLHLINFRMPVGESYFLEIAKLRAFKILWHNLIKAFLPHFDMIPQPFIHCETALPAISENMHTNLLRTTTSAMSAVLGGCEALTVSRYDAADPQAQHLAINIQNLLRYESHFDQYRDAADGSYYIETLCVQIAENAWAVFKSVENG